MSWNKDGCFASGKYLGVFPFTGIVMESRVKYGGNVQYTISLHDPIEVYGAVRDAILMDMDSDITFKSVSDVMGF